MMMTAQTRIGTPIVPRNKADPTQSSRQVSRMFNVIEDRYRGTQPAHVGLVLNRQALHSRGENGSVRMDSLLVIQRAFTKVEFFEYGAG